MAEVYLARQLHGDELVALKRIRPELLERGDVVAAFRREAQISSLLRHEHIVGLEAFGEDEDGPWLALAYVHGRALSDLLRIVGDRNQTLPLPAALTVCRDLALALQHAHGFRDEARDIRGVVHRDVSPDNVLVSYEGVARLSDFGIARWMEATVLTQTGMVKGKLPFMAPELYDGHDADEVTDTFALGATLYTVFAGIRPFGGKNEAETMRAVQSATPAQLTILRPEVPPRVAQWIHAALDKQRERRPPIGAFIAAADEALALMPRARAALAQAMQEAFPSRSEAPAVRSTPLHRQTQVARRRHSAPEPRRRGRALTAVLVVALVAAAAGAGAFFATRGATAQPVMTQQPAPVVAAPAPAPAAAVAVAALETAPVEAPAAKPPEPPAPEEAQRVEAPEAPARPKRTERRRTRAAVAVREKTSPVTGPGKLWVRAWPWAEVFVNGVSRGRTPLQPFELPAGKHTVLLVNQSLGANETRTVVVKTGEQAVVKVVLEAAK